MVITGGASSLMIEGSDPTRVDYSHSYAWYGWKSDFWVKRTGKTLSTGWSLVMLPKYEHFKDLFCILLYRFGHQFAPQASER